MEKQQKLKVGDRIYVNRMNKWFAAFVISLFKTMLQIRKFDLDAANRTIELIGLLTFLLGTTSTLVVLDCERIMLVPLMLTVFEYNYNECFNKLEDK